MATELVVESGLMVDGGPLVPDQESLVGIRIFFSLAVLVALAQTVPAQEKPGAVKIHLDAPKGWRGEAIQLPPSFAPKMTWKGLEEVRFAPGMFDPKKDDFF